MFGIREAIYNKLTSDSTLLALLSNGANSVLNEGDLTATTTLPCVVIHSAGTRAGGLPTLAFEVWEIRCYDVKGSGFYSIDGVLERIVSLLDNASLNSSSSKYDCLEFIWNWETPAYFDAAFNANFKAVRFQVYMTKR
jgi:hypothetical protein